MMLSVPSHHLPVRRNLAIADTLHRTSPVDHLFQTEMLHRMPDPTNPHPPRYILVRLFERDLAHFSMEHHKRPPFVVFFTHWVKEMLSPTHYINGGFLLLLIPIQELGTTPTSEVILGDGALEAFPFPAVGYYVIIRAIMIIICYKESGNYDCPDFLKVTK
jgi:hypothetical protein